MAVVCIGHSSRLQIAEFYLLSYSHLFKGYESVRVTTLAVGKYPLLGVGGIPLTALGFKVKKGWQPMVSGFSRLPLLILMPGMVRQELGKG